MLSVAGRSLGLIKRQREHKRISKEGAIFGYFSRQNDSDSVHKDTGFLVCCSIRSAGTSCIADLHPPP